jgi:3-keto-disaccharide hydrolase
MTSRSLITLFSLLLVLSACSGENTEATDNSIEMAPPEDAGPNMLTDAEKADGWVSLFDGQSMAAWRGYQAEEMPAGWTIEGDAVVMTEPGHGGDIVTREQYANFELKLEWRVPEGGNSGIMFHVTEDHGSPWATGPEMQILDNDAFEGGAVGKNSAGSNYDVHPPAVDASRPAGEWNSVHMIVNGPHVEHWMNGQKVVEYELWTDEWRDKVNGSKWIDHPDYGMRETGLIALQGDHTSVAFRNMKIKSL